MLKCTESKLNHYDKIFTVTASLLFTAALSAQLHLNTDAPVKNRVNDLLSQMTLEEKVMLL
jgi:hypothetical protein